MTLSNEARLLGEEPAFPQVWSAWDSWQRGAGILGLTKREYFIAGALANLDQHSLDWVFDEVDQLLERLAQERRATP